MVRELTLEELKTDQDLEKKIVVFNDDVNTFQWVSQSLVEICEHSWEQAEQCSWIIHFKGKYAVKSGSKDDLVPRCQALLDRGLTAEIQ